MIRLLTLCILLTIATLCQGDDGAAEFDSAPDSNTHEGAFADASPAELQRLSTIDEETRKILSKYLSKRFDEYEARISQLEDELASRSKSNPQPQYATPTPAPAPPSPYTPPPKAAAYSPYRQPDYAQPAATWPRRQAQTNRTQYRPPDYAQPAATSPQQTPSTPAKTWQRFNLNGRWFYIVPVEHVDAFTPPQPE